MWQAITQPQKNSHHSHNKSFTYILYTLQNSSTQKIFLSRSGFFIFWLQIRGSHSCFAEDSSIGGVQMNMLSSNAKVIQDWWYENEWVCITSGKTVSLPFCPPQTDVEWPGTESEPPHEEVSDD